MENDRIESKSNNDEVNESGIADAKRLRIEKDVEVVNKSSSSINQDEMGEPTMNDWDDFDDDFAFLDQPLLVTRGYVPPAMFYEIITKKEVRDLADNMVQEIQDILLVSSSCSEILLNNFEWKKDKLVEAFFANNGDLQALFSKRNLMNPIESSYLTQRSRLEAKDECTICYNDFDDDSNMMLQNYCTHLFCRPCWSSLVVKSILNGKYEIKCPEFQCKAILASQFVKDMIDEPRILELYETIRLGHFMNCYKQIKPCPSPKSCPSYVNLKWMEAKAVTCNCGLKYCFKCSKAWHGPISCEVWKKLIEKLPADLTSIWLRERTKNCPKCSALIERTEGCDDMKCTNHNCEYQFCWNCLRPAHTDPTGVCKRVVLRPAVVEQRSSTGSTPPSTKPLYDQNLNFPANTRLEKSIDMKKAQLKTLTMLGMGVQFLQLIDDTLEILHDSNRVLALVNGAIDLLDIAVCDMNQVTLVNFNRDSLGSVVDKLEVMLQKNIELTTIKMAMEFKDDVLEVLAMLQKRRDILEAIVQEGDETHKLKYLQ